MYKLTLLLVPCVLSVVLVLGDYGYGDNVLSQGYPFYTYQNAVSLMNSNNYGYSDRQALASYNNPNKWSFLLPLALLLALSFNLTGVPVIG